MKKVLLTSVAALAIFASAAPVFATQGDQFVEDIENNDLDLNNLNEKDRKEVFGQYRQAFDVTRESERLAANTPEGQTAVLEYTDTQGVVRRVEVKGTMKVAAKTPAKPAAKAPAAGTKALPKTSAVK